METNGSEEAKEEAKATPNGNHSNNKEAELELEEGGIKDKEEETPLASSVPMLVEESQDVSKANGNQENGEDDDEEDEEDEEDEDEESSEEEEEEEEEVVDRRLRRRQVDTVRELKRKERTLLRQISKTLKKPSAAVSAEESEVLRLHPKLADEARRRLSKRRRLQERVLEVEDRPEVLAKKCLQLAKAIQKARNLVVYTGAGISTAANIPDYRGPNGVWTLLDQGKEVAACNLDQASPTFTHMALFSLFKKGKLKHVVSQNCDGLHMRSGIPRYALSEIHGNMFVEICKHCKPMRPFVRVFDVTERTNKNRHATMRRCYVCGNSLYDTIVHFGEKGSLKWPINWSGANKAAEKADVILCLGSSLKVLRRYTWLWCMDRPVKLRPKLYIVNLQWTPKDSAAKIKLNGKCDEVMAQVMAMLDTRVPDYHCDNDPLLSFATPLSPYEMHTTTRKDMLVKEAPKVPENDEAADAADENGQNGMASVSCDHDYASSSSPSSRSKRPKRQAATKSRNNGQLVDAALLDFKSITWPRDALYLPYEPSFEYIEEAAAIGEDAFCCDCCDPAKQRRRNGEEEDSEDEEEEDNDEEEEEEGGKIKGEVDEGDDSKDSKDFKNGVDVKEEEDKPEAAGNGGTDSPKSSTPTITSHPPGWFGKGRRRKAKC